MFNLPISNSLAVRAVVYTDEMGGFIDNVPGQIDLRESARFRRQAPCDPTACRSALVAKASKPTQTCPMSPSSPLITAIS
jgi:hypothetical protein